MSYYSDYIVEFLYCRIFVVIVGLADSGAGMGVGWRGWDDGIKPVISTYMSDLWDAI